jgi:hypothetical protein
MSQTVHEVAQTQGWGDRYLVSDEDGNDVNRQVLVREVINVGTSRVICETANGLRIEIQRLHEWKMS